MMRRLSLWGFGLVAIVLAAQFLLRDPSPPTEDSPRLEPPRQEPPAVDPSPAPPAPPPSAEPVPPEAIASNSPGVVDVESPAPPGPDGSRRFGFSCADGNMFAIRVLDGEATVFSPQVLGAEALTLLRTEAAYGARYASNDAVYWNKGAVATFEIRGQTYADCAADPVRAREMEARRRGATFRALGNEPAWVLEVGHDRIELAMELGTRRVDFAHRAPVTVGARTTYRSFTGTQELVVVIDRMPCNDTMSGELFDNAVAVTFEGTTMYGCGRAPR